MALPSGNTLVIGGTTAVSIAITWGGVFAPWGSSKVLVPLVVGLVVLGLFILWEARWATHPLVPYLNPAQSATWI